MKGRGLKMELGYFQQRPLFSEAEKPKAEIILNQLEGMSIISAWELLEKCSRALFRSNVSMPELRDISQKKNA